LELNPYAIHPYDNDKVKELKKNIVKAYDQQQKLVDKYKSVQQYRKLQQDIGLMKTEIERIQEEEYWYGGNHG